MSVRSPILFMVFNRPETTRRVFEAIRQARPARLYVAADGPRAARAGEEPLCAEVRRIATAVDWPCEVHTLLRERNLGCKMAVSSAISWFFEHEAEGIIIEDDCLPDPAFFAYCDELLERYRDVEQVMCVSGVNFVSKVWSPASSYYFSRYAHIWGWASWRRAWQHYDVSMQAWRSAELPDMLPSVFPESAQERRYWKRIFDEVSRGDIDTWDYQWACACWSRGGLTCLPEANLITNIGFGAAATHTVSAESKLANLPAGPLAMPLRHPDKVERAIRADRWTSRHIFEIDSSLLGLTRWRRRFAGGMRRVRLALGS